VTAAHILPDVLQPGLRLVFCGTAPGPESARRGLYYAHPGNRFWRTLHATGLVPEPLGPADYPRLPAFGIGLTDVAKFDWGLDAALPRTALGLEARADLHRRIAAAAPRMLAFTSKRAGVAGLGGPRAYGEQPDRIGETRLWVLPSPSGLASGAWDIRHWQALADAVRS
jgi:TDG/mug DNA glycosylase family protein